MDNNLKERIKGYYLLKGKCGLLQEEIDNLTKIFSISPTTAKELLTQLEATGDITLKYFQLFEMQELVQEYVQTQIRTQKQQYTLYTNVGGQELLEKALQDEFKKHVNTVPGFKKYKAPGFKKKGKKKP